MSIQNIIVPEGWHPITWTRSYDDLIAIIMVGPDEICVWRVKSTENSARQASNFLHKDGGGCRSFQEALHEVELAVKQLASPLYKPAAGLGGTLSQKSENEIQTFLKKYDNFGGGQ